MKENIKCYKLLISSRKPHKVVVAYCTVVGDHYTLQSPDVLDAFELYVKEMLEYNPASKQFISSNVVEGFVLVKNLLKNYISFYI